ncbi:hypothetical protein [Hyunsoonleella pacifica]|uniref:Uncharacterized protein n=1 Tax=Hyunsoonleella pacifica TaxID=1080224 RepID=A0A4Q9FRN4_9FLAO|nr:hypothetical protein [Hyunsoonleella pacifica]TBN17516.1 hypothetical protein EYD46_04160 [Hyunsoonleella pacifica]GGD11274.1 hypothetical protein GCM10011368_11580 [Hyunsoonleella pacifica]
MRKLLFLIVLMPLFIISQNDDSFLLTLSEVTVKPGHNAQFIAGVKAWKECYLKNEGKDKWNMWKRLQGEGNVYTISGRMANWAEMDEDGDEAGKACRMTVVDLIMPHVKSFHYNIARFMPDVSRKAPFSENTGLVWVYNVKIKNSTTFMECVKAIATAVKKAEKDNRGYWYSVVGGAPEVADYFISVPFDNFAGLDVEQDGVWKVYEKANGKEKTEALRNKFRASLSHDWSYIYTLQKKLSN